MKSEKIHRHKQQQHHQEQQLQQQQQQQLEEEKKAVFHQISSSPSSSVSVSSSPSSSVSSGPFSNCCGDVVGKVKKKRKAYTLTKPRQLWTDDEHQKFVKAIQLYKRDWAKIKEHVGTKTVIQIRSHAQKYFNKMEKLGRHDLIPAKRAKKIKLNKTKKKQVGLLSGPTLSKDYSRLRNRQAVLAEAISPSYAMFLNLYNNPLIAFDQSLFYPFYDQTSPQLPGTSPSTAAVGVGVGTSPVGVGVGVGSSPVGVGVGVGTSPMSSFVSQPPPPPPPQTLQHSTHFSATSILPYPNDCANMNATDGSNSSINGGINDGNGGGFQAQLNHQESQAQQLHQHHDISNSPSSYLSQSHHEDHNDLPVLPQPFPSNHHVVSQDFLQLSSSCSASSSTGNGTSSGTGTGTGTRTSSTTVGGSSLSSSQCPIPSLCRSLSASCSTNPASSTVDNLSSRSCGPSRDLEGGDGGSGRQEDDGRADLDVKNEEEFEPNKLLK